MNKPDYGIFPPLPAPTNTDSNGTVNHLFQAWRDVALTHGGEAYVASMIEEVKAGSVLPYTKLYESLAKDYPASDLDVQARYRQLIDGEVKPSRMNRVVSVGKALLAGMSLAPTQSL